MVDYLIGGIAMTDRDATKDLVEDAVLKAYHETVAQLEVAAE